ncbi:hypothetical protein LWI29_001005 [Acer saccharum]|uniref:Prolyl endopeptidase-like n=1 Tax=Acer saccharum TaxID=4024 RepID=A0AA39RFL6_ACESA|nr:hypothetical protein LWI29_001005 [Acer saccharum]
MRSCEANTEQLPCASQSHSWQSTTTIGDSTSVGANLPSRTPRPPEIPHQLLQIFRRTQHGHRLTTAVLGGFDASNYVTERKWATASDGTQIPISIVYRKNLVKLDGSDMLLLYGYGSYEKKKYRSKEKLCIDGRSAGGLLIGAVLNMRPDLFKAAIAGVPFVDVVTTMLDPTIPLTTSEWEEWGDPRKEEFYFYMKSYSPVDNVSTT